MKRIEPILSVVGAGPGDPELLTIKAVRTLATADVVLYDALVSDRILDYIPASTPKIFVGKRAGYHSYTQHQINDLIIDLAFTYGHVVRLKGGDPFVFGRGSEEIEHAQLFNIQTAYVPGISSSIGVPGLQQIPVTHRGISESFWVITGTTSAGKISADVELAAATNATVIILMGINKLKEITDVFRKHRKSSLPIAIIQNGSLPDEKCVIGKIEDIEEKAKNENINAPATIIIGEVVSLHPGYELPVIKNTRSANPFFILN